MKKFIVGALILLFSASAFSKDQNIYSAADNILVTFLNSPGAEIDTVVIIKDNYSVRFKGSYKFKGEKETKYSRSLRRSYTLYHSNSYSYCPNIDLNIENKNKKSEIKDTNSTMGSWADAFNNM